MARTSRRTKDVIRRSHRRATADRVTVTRAPVTVTATEAKNRFGPLLESAIQGRSVVITKHDTPKAVLLSIAEFDSLSRSRQIDLAALSSEFDNLLTRMQSTSRRKALKSAFDAPPAELAKLAVANARTRG